MTEAKALPTEFIKMRHYYNHVGKVPSECKCMKINIDSKEFVTSTVINDVLTNE